MRSVVDKEKLKKSISGILGAINLDPGYLNSAALDDLYEAYLFSLCVKAARNKGYSVRVVNGQNGGLILRRGPGVIYSGNYSHLELTKSGEPDLEVHLGIRIEGASAVPHEADISILFRNEADRARGCREHPRSRGVLICG